MTSILLHHWAFYAYSSWVLILLTVNLWPRRAIRKAEAVTRLGREVPTYIRKPKPRRYVFAPGIDWTAKVVEEFGLE